MAGDLSEELLAIRLELQGVRETVEGYQAVREEQDRTVGSTRALGSESEESSKKVGLLERAFGTLGKVAKYSAGILGVGAVFALHSAIEKTEELSKSTSVLSNNLGFTTQAASRWSLLTEAWGIGASSLKMSFGTLSSKMVEAGRKGGTLLTPFHQLGISQEEVAKGADNFQFGLWRVINALSEEEGGSKRATAAKALLGRGYNTLMPILAKGAKGLKEQLHWADEFGGTLSGKTQKGLEDLHESSVKSQIALESLQVSVTSALGPAIEYGDDQVQEFIKTLNDPKLSAEQKIGRIERQFEGLEDDVLGLLEAMLPKVAEEGGQLGVKLAGALWHSFVNSGPVGKLVIAAWVYKSFGGEAVLKAGASRVGGTIGSELGLGIATGAVGGFIAYEVWEHMSEGSKLGIERWVSSAAEWFVNGLIAGINKGIHAIDEVFNKANVFSFLGVSAPQISEVGSVEFGQQYREEERHLKSEEGYIDGPGGELVKAHPSPVDPAPGHHHRKRGVAVPNNPAQAARRRGGSSPAGRRHIHITVQSILDGRVVAESTTGVVDDEAALR